VVDIFAKTAKNAKPAKNAKLKNLENLKKVLTGATGRWYNIMLHSVVLLMMTLNF